MNFFSWVTVRDDQACEKIDGLVYKQLDIRPRLAVIPPTILLAPFPLVAAQATAGWWTAVIVGGAWSGSLALAAWTRYRVLGITASGTLLLASLVVLYR
nr:hypothetical protein OH837_21425 [Streptomyces canus]